METPSLKLRKEAAKAKVVDYVFNLMTVLDLKREDMASILSELANDLL